MNLFYLKAFIDSLIEKRLPASRSWNQHKQCAAVNIAPCAITDPEQNPAHSFVLLTSMLAINTIHGCALCWTPVAVEPVALLIGRRGLMPRPTTVMFVVWDSFQRHRTIKMFQHKYLTKHTFILLLNIVIPILNSYIIMRHIIMSSVIFTCLHMRRNINHNKLTSCIFQRTRSNKR